MPHSHTLSSLADQALADTFAFGLEDTAAGQQVGDLTQADLEEIDRQFASRRDSGAIQRERDHRAVEEQVQFFRCVGVL